MALFAFDGTMCTPNDRSNVFRLYNNSPDNKKYYFTGPGSRGTWLSKAIEAVTGHGSKDRLNDALDIYECWKKHRKRYEKITIVGFSRGGVTALEFAHKLEEYGERVELLALFDPVGAFGNPFNSIDVGYRKTLPPNVLTCLHAIAAKKTYVNRQALQKLEWPETDFYWSVDRVYRSQVFNGGHGFVGGTEGDDEALDWVFGNSPDVWIGS